MDIKLVFMVNITIIELCESGMSKLINDSLTAFDLMFYNVPSINEHRVLQVTIEINYLHLVVDIKGKFKSFADLFEFRI